MLDARDVGGTLYVHHPGHEGWEDVVDLSVTGHAACPPRQTPHMVLPSPQHDIVAITYTKDSVVHLLNASSKKVISCMEAPTTDSRVHTGAWYANGDDLFFVMVDMTGSLGLIGTGGGGGLLLWSVADGGRRCTLRDTFSAGNYIDGPTKPIAAYANPHGAFASVFAVTDANGGMYFVETVAYDGSLVYKGRISSVELGDAGGGLWLKAHPNDDEIVVAQYGKQSAGQSFLFAINLRTLSLVKTFVLPLSAIDAHGVAFCTNAATDDLYILNTNRVSATLDILRYTDGEVVISYDLDAMVGDRAAPRTTPCLADGAVVDHAVAPPAPPYEFLMGRRLDVTTAGEERSGERTSDDDTAAARKRVMPDVAVLVNHTLYVVTRGRFPLSAVAPANWFTDARAALYSFRVAPDCRSVGLTHDSVALAMNDARTTIEAADGHGLDVVGSRVWAIDQAPTGKAIRTRRGSVPLFGGVTIEIEQAGLYVPKPFISWAETTFNATLRPAVVRPAVC